MCGGPVSDEECSVCGGPVSGEESHVSIYVYHIKRH